MKKKKKRLLSALSFLFLLVLCYTAFPRQMLPASADATKTFTLIIDAGHGGEDGGAVSQTGVQESGLNLTIALKTESLSALLGVKPLMVRDSDISVHDDSCKTISEKKNSDLRNRVRLVESTADAVLLSIHQNHFSQSKYHGAQVFYAKTAGSSVFAEKLQEDLRLALDPGNHRQCKLSQNVYLMEHISCPAVLVECGFLSNSAETQLLQDETYQKKLAMAVLRAVVRDGKAVTEDHEV